MATIINCDTCEFDTADIRKGMEHATATGHSLSAPMNEDGISIRISVDPDDDFDEDDDWNAEDQ